MAKLVVKLHGQKLTELELSPGREYFAGRASDSDILLTNERGISRQHIKIYEKNNIWTAVLISKYGGLIDKNQSVNQVSLEEDTVFLVPPYEFSFVAHEGQVGSASSLDKEVAAEIQSSEKSQKAALAPVKVSTDEIFTSKDHTHTSARGNLEATSVGVINLIAYIKIANSKNQTEELLKLEGNNWAFGRHPGCEVVIEDSAISRKHFEITRTSEGYFVTDHGSSNGTKINSEKISANTTIKITSGDVISIRHISILFEIHDSTYQNKISNLPAMIAPEQTNSIASDDVSQNTGTGSLLVPVDASSGPSLIRIPPKSSVQKYSQKFKDLNTVQKAVVVLSLVLFVGIIANIFSTNDGKRDSGSIESQKDEQASAPMSDEKQKQARDIFHIARNQYLQRKYSLCISQIEKLHAIVPFYENSKEIEHLCNQALELEKIEEDRRNKIVKKQELENEVKKVIAKCETAMTSTTTYDEITTCLAPVFSLDPENSNATELQMRIKIREEEALEQQRKISSYQNRKAEGKLLFSKAEKNFKSGNLKLALKNYKSFINNGYPEMNVQNDIANRNIASIKQILANKLSAQIKKCEEASTLPDLKFALLTCDEVLKEYPGNYDTIRIRKKTLSKLQTKTRELYNDSVLEENIGNVEAAKEKWQQIQELSIPEDDYYKKSKSKLKKYGIGL